MVAFLLYPLYLLEFWYRDVLGGIISFFVSLNRYIASLFSLPLLLRTFFRPLKNEYRDGLIVFSIIFGMIVKSFLIMISIFVILIVLMLEVLVLLFVAALPVILTFMVFGYKQ